MESVELSLSSTLMGSAVAFCRRSVLFGVLGWMGMLELDGRRSKGLHPLSSAQSWVRSPM